jgi:hypothetical protein
MIRRLTMVITGAIVAAFVITTAKAQQYPTIRNTQPASAGPAYWTPERMAAAKPRELAVATTLDLRVPAVAVPKAPGAPGVAGGTEPPDQLPASMQDELDNGAPTPLDGSYPGPNNTVTRNLAINNNINTVPLGQYLSYPWQTVGRLFFTEPGVGDFECSAAATYGGAALNIVWTAGHCIANGGHATFYTNWLFCPAYKNGVNANIGCWNWSVASTSAAWFNNGAFSRDYAIVGMQPNGTVKSGDVVSNVGGLGFAWNWGRDQLWVHTGYPAQGPCPDGLNCVSVDEHRYDVNMDSFGPAVNSWGDQQTPGASGSPGILAFQNGNWINTDTSFYFSSGPNGNEFGHELQGPYFDTNTCNFWKNWTGWGGSC